MDSSGVHHDLNRDPPSTANDGATFEQSELARAQSAKKAVWAVGIKRDFLANVSHEFRTPIYGIVGMLELALEEELTPSLRDYLQTARDSSGALLRLVDEILDFSRLESGEFTLEPSVFSLRSLFGETLEESCIAASTKGLTAACDVAPDVPDALIGDAGRLRQVLGNLLSNAVKFSTQGEIWLRVRVAARRETSVDLVFEIEDQGIGISQDDQDRIFTPFAQVDASTTRSQRGTGLGLTIASELVELMGGRIEVKSSLGERSTFSFKITLPLDRGAGPMAEISEARDRVGARAAGGRKESVASAVRVLLAEDTLATQKIVKNILTKRGHYVRVASNGREVVELVRSQPFDLVLMDVQMPTMDGLQATSAIRAMESNDGRHVPIVAMTAHAMQGDRERCLEAGMDAYLSKPVTMANLIKLVESMSSSRDEVRTCSSGSACAGASGGGTDRSIVDLESAVSRLGRDHQLLDDLIGFFLEDYPVLLGQARQGIAGGNAALAARAAHSLKGLSASFDAHLAVRAAAQLERTARQASLDGARAMLESLENELSRVRDALLAHRESRARGSADENGSH